MLQALQQQLSDIYQVGHGYDVRDYLITDPMLARIIGEDAMLTNTEETLLVSQDEQGLALSLFLDGDLLAVHRTPEARNGQIVVARLDEEVTVKRFRRRGSRVQLIPENIDFEPIEVDLRRQELVIEGLGVGVIRPKL